MLREVGAFILLGSAFVIETLQLSQKISITEANFGENVIMKCTTVGLEQRMVYWHKLQFGFMIQTIAFGSSPDLPLKEGFNNSRYSAKKEGNEYSLEIRNVSKEDQGTYFCQAGTSYTMTFIYGSHLVLKEKHDKKTGSLKYPSPNETLLYLGQSTLLQCCVLKEKSLCTMSEREY
uniref:Ig-like domain-containing protein n=1 Tax=Oryzias latipes TaxID=8090 RepID=A0A3P9KAZ7_ORYLA